MSTTPQTGSKPRILMVDDEPNVLSGYRRALGRTYDMVTAEGGEQGLAVLGTQAPFSVIVTDMRMPQMDGVAFLREARKRAPESIYMMLTGNADQGTAVSAINEGGVFRFLNKPCPPELLEHAIESALRHYELARAERVLLRETLAGSIKLLIEAVTVSSVPLASMVQAVRNDTHGIMAGLGCGDDWQVSLASSLCLLGLVVHGHSDECYKLSQEQLEQCAGSGSKLLRHIPRLEGVAAMIRRQREAGALPSSLDFARPEVREIVGARILRFVVDFECQVHEAMGNRAAALARMRAQAGVYDARLVKCAEGLGDATSVTSPSMRLVRKSVPSRALEPGMITDEDVVSNEGKLLLSKGRELSLMTIERLRSMVRGGQLRDSVTVLHQVDGAARTEQGGSSQAA